MRRDRPDTALPFDTHLPDGFRNQGDFITGEEERHLASEIGGIQLATFEMHGVAADAPAVLDHISHRTPPVWPLILTKAPDALMSRERASRAV
jgi:hypothetical protein